MKKLLFIILAFIVLGLVGNVIADPQEQPQEAPEEEAPQEQAPCEFGWTGSTCTVPICYGLASNNPAVCSGNGICTSPNACVCAQGFTGANCNEQPQVPEFGVIAASVAIVGALGIFIYKKKQ